MKHSSKNTHNDSIKLMVCDTFMVFEIIEYEDERPSEINLITKPYYIYDLLNNNQPVELFFNNTFTKKSIRILIPSEIQNLIISQENEKTSNTNIFDFVKYLHSIQNQKPDLISLFKHFNNKFNTFKSNKLDDYLFVNQQRRVSRKKIELIKDEFISWNKIK